MYQPTKFIFIHGPNGVGKSTVCKAVHQRLSRSAWLESEWCRMTNPFTFDDAMIALTIFNITHMLRGYLTSESLDYVIFSYGFHGPRQKIWDTVQANLADVIYDFVPITLTCDEDENIRRMKQHRRDPARIQRALRVRHLYNNLPYPLIDATHLTVDQTAERIVHLAQA